MGTFDILASLRGCYTGWITKIRQRLERELSLVSFSGFCWSISVQMTLISKDYSEFQNAKQAPGRNQYGDYNAPRSAQVRDVILRKDGSHFGSVHEILERWQQCMGQKMLYRVLQKNCPQILSNIFIQQGFLSRPILMELDKKP